MITFNLLMLLNSGRLAPALLLWLVSLLITVPSPDTSVEDASSLFLAFVAVSLIAGIASGNLDTDEHRDLLAVTAGSPGRLHGLRVVAGLLPVAVMTAPTVFALVATDPPFVTTSSSGVIETVAAVAGYLMAGVLTGSSFAAFLYVPIVRHRAIPFLGGLASLILVAVLPPVQAAIRDANVSGGRSALLLFAGSVVVFGVAVTASAALAAARSR